MKLDNIPVLDNSVLGQYNEIAGNLSAIQEVIYDLFDVSNKKDEIPFDENDYDYRVELSNSIILEKDLLEYEEQLENGKITDEQYRDAVKWLKFNYINKVDIEEINESFAKNIQNLFALILKIKSDIDEKIVEGYVFSFKSNIEDIIMQNGKFLQVVTLNSNIDLQEISISPYLYMFNVLAREVQRINKDYTYALLEKDLNKRLKLLGSIDFSDLNLLAKFEDTIEKFDKNIANIEMLEYYTNSFKQNIEYMGNKISFAKVLSYKTQILRILNTIIDNLLSNPDFNTKHFIDKEFIQHLLLVQNGLANNIKQVTETENKNLLFIFPDLTNIIRIHNLRKRKILQSADEMINEINSIDVTKLSKEEVKEAQEELDKIFNNGSYYK